MHGDELAGYAFATRWMYEVRGICWVTQLCVRVEYRRKGLATEVCGLVLSTSRALVYIVGISSCELCSWLRISFFCCRFRDGDVADMF